MKKKISVLFLTVMFSTLFFGFKFANAENLDTVSMVQNHKYLFLASKDQGKIYVFYNGGELDNVGKLVKIITTGYGPSHLLLDGGNDANLFVALSDAKKIQVFDAYTLELKGEIVTPKNPYWLARDNDKLFVTVSIDSGPNFEPFVVYLNSDNVGNSVSKQAVWPTKTFYGNEHSVINPIIKSIYFDTSFQSSEDLIRFDYANMNISENTAFYYSHSSVSLGDGDSQFVLRGDKIYTIGGYKANNDYKLQVLDSETMIAPTDGVNSDWINIIHQPKALDLGVSDIYISINDFNVGLVMLYDVSSHHLTKTYHLPADEQLLDRGISTGISYTNNSFAVSNKSLYLLERETTNARKVYSFADATSSATIILPKISNISATVGLTASDPVTITWITDLISDSYVSFIADSETFRGDYPPNTSLVDISDNDIKDKFHNVRLTALKANQLYWYKVKSSVDSGKNFEESFWFSFKTACSKDYVPVCGEVSGACLKTVCGPKMQNFKNKCEMERYGAKYLYDGVCKNDDKTVIDTEKVDTQKVADKQIVEIENTANLLINDKTAEVLAKTNQLRDLIKEQEAKVKYLENLLKEAQGISSQMTVALNNFITYGVDSNTQGLGAGERAAVIYSYESAFDKLPETEAELADLIKIASGRWPSVVSDEAEKVAKEQFAKIYKRIPDMSNPQDVAAITVMAYGLRQTAVNRNLGSEATGIKTFIAIYGKTPSTTEDWNIVQAITYSGSSRGVDTDGDLLTDDREKMLGTNPKIKDTDGDGFSDGAEVANGYDPLKK